MKINAEKFDDIAVTSICESPNTPKITNIAYEEVNNEIITHFISLKIKNKTPKKVTDNIIIAIVLII